MEQTREDAAKEILGDQPGIRMEHTDHITTATPWAAAAITASDPEQAAEFAHELLEVIQKGFPAWRGWGVEKVK